ncbi:MAG: glycosyl transferase [Deltaproteobacteria bacterium HGW-Deltaproteobacteria-21]|nr:MAG: glycosyl transferase [Deltaproteobacteria bacterium HGW-Deltaproteobacteria-21]
MSGPNPGRSKKIRIAFLLQDLKFGGTQRQAIQLAGGLDRARFEPEIWVLMGGRDFLPWAESMDIPVALLGKGSYVWPPDLWKLWLRIRSRPVDILYLLTGIPNIWGRIFGRLLRVPVIVGACRDHVLWYERFLASFAHCHVCNSVAIREYVMDRYHLSGEKTTVIPNGVDLEYFSPPQREYTLGNPVILNIGRLVKDKDQATLIEAFSLVVSKVDGVELWIVGDGPLSRRIRGLAARSGLSGRVRILPAQADLRPLFKKACVFALSSIREALPNVVIEAMACGLPVVATDVGGLGELVVPGVTGSLVPPASPSALAEALTRVLSDASIRGAFGRAGRERVEKRFALSRMVERHVLLFQELLNRSSRSSAKD